MKFTLITATLFAAFAVAAPSPNNDLVARQCSCTKVGDEWICRGRLCAKDVIPEATVVKRDKIEARQCSCTKIGDEWICRGRLCN
ncbi:hypothetical protein BKA56DRAFT_72682 [Ilyonectria sp. MPI-CAGE-AT-0026]|nr:hypothetical protein BKA56DRAFT_72682 [Ilyonectria sp. MPI-CAGE-AT-0026]